MGEVRDLREYEAATLRPAWDSLARRAEQGAGVTNWDSAPAGYWDREDAVSYSNRVMRWAVQVTRVLEAADPTGLSRDPEFGSLRTTWNFHVAKVIHLQKLGISTPRVPSDLEAVWSGIKQGVLDAPDTIAGIFRGAVPVVLGVILIILLARGD